MAALGVHVHLDGHDLKLDRVAVSRRIVPMRQVVKAMVDHPQRVAQVLLPTRPPGQVGKVGGDACAVRRVVVLIETNAFEAESKFFVHDDLLRGWWR
jgi:hypothetical protein